MNCLNCGEEITGDKRNKYCSRACSHEDLNKKRKEASEAKRKRICQECGKEFIMPHQSAKARRGEIQSGLYCSRRCRFDALKKQPKSKTEAPASSRIYISTCGICGKLFTSKRKRERCSRECDLEHSRRNSFRINSGKKELKKRKCKECGAMFTPEYGNKRRSFCSTECLRRNARRIRRHKERAKLRLVKVETVDPVKVFERDGWRCQICRRKLRPKDKGTYKDSAPELDHIIPLSKGGEHSYRNTQCLCRRCNADKSGNERGQLRLFG